MFGTSALTPPSAYRGALSSQPYYTPEIPFNVSEGGSESVEVEDTDDESESPLLPHNLRDDLDDRHEGHHAAQAATVE